MIPHGTPTRAQTCGCLACVRQRPTKRLRWPIGPLVDHVGADYLRPFFSTNEWTSMAANGVTDNQLDQLCVRFGVHPGSIYLGYFEAGLDDEGIFE